MGVASFLEGRSEASGAGAGAGRTLQCGFVALNEALGLLVGDVGVALWTNPSSKD